MAIVNQVAGFILEAERQYEEDFTKEIYLFLEKNDSRIINEGLRQLWGLSKADTARLAMVTWSVVHGDSPDLLYHAMASQGFNRIFTSVYVEYGNFDAFADKSPFLEENIKKDEEKRASCGNGQYREYLKLRDNENGKGNI